MGWRLTFQTDYLPRPPRPQVQVVIPKKTKTVPNVQRKPPAIPKPLSRLRNSQKATAARKKSSIRRDAVTPSQSTGRTSNSRLARCGPVEQYHAYTYIPYLPPDMKPDPPRRDPDDADPRFTDDDKVFFIHYLQWRLHKGVVPKKEVLYAELAKQVSVTMFLYEVNHVLFLTCGSPDPIPQRGVVEAPLGRRARTPRPDLHCSAQA